jgi:hypothetical protein
MARGDDAGNLKQAVIVWVDEIFGSSKPPLKPNSKDERGLRTTTPVISFVLENTIGKMLSK